MALLITVVLVASCGGTQPTTTTATTPLTTTTTTQTTATPTTTTPMTTTTTTTPPAMTTTTTTATPTMTWGELAARGFQSFSNNCAPCHGLDGGGDFGPPIIGSSLKRFETAQQLFDFISTQMPQDGPGSLSVSNYLRILAFMLTESGFVLPEVIFDTNNLANVILN